MSCVWLCSDWHLGHQGISQKFRKEFDTDQDHDQFFLDAYYKAGVKKRDIIFMLGDMVITQSGFDIIEQLHGDKRIILGNHDLERGCKLDDFQQHFTQIHGALKYKEFWMTHIPIHPNELYGKKNLHGHVHNKSVDDDRYINLCPEFLMPEFGSPIIKFQDLRQWLNRSKSDAK